MPILESLLITVIDTNLIEFATEIGWNFLSLLELYEIYYFSHSKREKLFFWPEFWQHHFISFVLQQTTDLIGVCFGAVGGFWRSGSLLTVAGFEMEFICLVFKFYPIRGRVTIFSFLWSYLGIVNRTFLLMWIYLRHSHPALCGRLPTFFSKYIPSKFCWDKFKIVW